MIQAKAGQISLTINFIRAALYFNACLHQSRKLVAEWATQALSGGEIKISRQETTDAPVFSQKWLVTGACAIIVGIDLSRIANAGVILVGDIHSVGAKFTAL